EISVLIPYLNMLAKRESLKLGYDSDEFHKIAKRYVVTHMLGAASQRRHHAHRDILVNNVMHRLHAHANDISLNILQEEILALGKDVGSSKFIQGLGETLSRDEIHKVSVLDQLSGLSEMDWRDFFPYLRWVPNKSFERHIGRIKNLNLFALCYTWNKLGYILLSEHEINCYLDRLMSKGKTLTQTQLIKLVWETLVASRTTDRLYRETHKVCGNNKYTEEKYSEVTFLSAIFHETLRRYPPFTIVLPLRCVHEDTQLGGYDIPAGTEIAINIYGCNMDKKQWDSPEEWKPERFLDSKYDPMDLYKTMSFGGGRRVCPGSSQGLSIACTAIARCIQEFREDQDTNTTPQKPKPMPATPRDY
ncbi:hypothetical protein MKW94_002240, partial [Papaver nudicaule]|nr:hypothetical protein [Papaver nudicaule]